MLKGQDGKEKPTTKLWISDVPLSCDGADIESCDCEAGLCPSLLADFLLNVR